MPGGRQGNVSPVRLDEGLTDRVEMNRHLEPFCTYHMSYRSALRRLRRSFFDTRSRLTK